MELRIFDKDQFVTVEFGNWLIPKIKSKIIIIIQSLKLRNLKLGDVWF